MEKKRKKKGRSKWEKVRENEDKIICPFDDKKVCPVTLKQKLSARRNSGGFLLYQESHSLIGGRFCIHSNHISNLKSLPFYFYIEKFTGL